MTSILLVENDSVLAHSLKQALTKPKRNLKHATTLKRAYELIQEASYDLVIVDRILDDGDGFELVSFVREISPVTRFIFLSQKGVVEDRIAGLTAGADDYIAKPFSLAEFRLKVEKILQTDKRNQEEYLQAGEILLYPETGSLQVADRAMHLRRREAEILSCLIRYRGSVVSRQMIIDRVWKTQKDMPSYTTLDVYIRRLRIRLGSHAHAIRTIRGFGYSLDR